MDELCGAVGGALDIPITTVSGSTLVTLHANQQWTGVQLKKHLLELAPLSFGKDYQILFGSVRLPGESQLCESGLKDGVSLTAIVVQKQQLLAVGMDSKMRLWILDDEDMMREFDMGLVLSTCVTKGEVATGHADGTTKLWSLDDGTQLKCFERHQAYVLSIRILGLQLITGSADCTAALWSIPDETQLKSFVGHTGIIRCLHVDGQELVTGSADFSARLWHLEDGLELRRFEGHQAPVASVFVNGRDLVTAASDNVRVWCLDSGDQLRLIGGDTLNLCSSFLAGRVLVTASNNTVDIWDFDTGVKTGTQITLRRIVSMFVCGDVLVTGGEDGTVSSWNIDDGIELRCFWRHSFGIAQVSVID